MSDAVKPDTSEAAVERAARILECDAARQDFHPPEMCGLDPTDESEIAALLRALLAERDAALSARDDAIRRLGDAARDAGRWRGISEGNDVVIKHLRAERDALRAQLAETRKALRDVLPYAQACIGRPRSAWPTDSVILKAEAALREAGHE